MWKDWHPAKGSAEWTDPGYRYWTRGSQYCTEQHSTPLQPITLLSLLYNIHFNVTLRREHGRSAKGSGSAAAQPSPHFFENSCQSSANPVNQALTEHSSRKSIKLLPCSVLLLFCLASATHFFWALLHTQHLPSHQLSPGKSRTESQGLRSPSSS